MAFPVARKSVSFYLTFPPLLTESPKGGLFLLHFPSSHLDRVTRHLPMEPGLSSCTTFGCTRDHLAYLIYIVFALPKAKYIISVMLNDYNIFELLFNISEITFMNGFSVW